MVAKKRLNAEGEPGPTKADWIIMLYIAADGNLANFAVESLKQLNNSTGNTNDPNATGKVVVAVQFAIDAPGGQQIPRYIFDGTNNGSLGNSLAGYLKAPDDMTEQQALISFLKWAYGHEKCKADKYALILWGHGPELLLQPASVQQVNDSCAEPQNGGHGLYLSPQDLRQALEEGIPEDKRKLQIIGFDACSMSMFEIAYEIRDQVEFMVASQEEVPDPSFPYDSIVQKFRHQGTNLAGLCSDGVYAYVHAYQDYICNAATGMKRVTLSALRLNDCEPLRKALERLACALWNAKEDPGLPALLVEARQCARDFAGGLYVDLYDFCKKLQRLVLLSLPEKPKAKVDQDKAPRDGGAGEPNGNGPADWTARRRDIECACNLVINALVENFANGLVLANSSADNRCHGVSLYFPYLSDQQYAQVRQPLVKGGTDTIGKGFSAVMNRAASSLLMCVRRQLIVDTEGYYEDLELSQDTGWYRFIAKQWSNILVQLAPEDLDILYSAQQSAVNAYKNVKATAVCSPYQATNHGMEGAAAATAQTGAAAGAGEPRK